MKLRHKAIGLALGATLCAATSASALAGTFWELKPYFIKGEISETHYDGVTDDLLTGGLGITGLLSATPPGFVDAENPTPAELRKLAIYNNYRALSDSTAAGGFGVLYGPNIDTDGNNTGTEGLVAGTEYISYATYGFPKRKVVLMVQVPDSFNPNQPCIVTGPSSGSRGVYGAIGTSGEWGLKNNCAVAYTDAGKGMGVHNLQNNTVNLIDGTIADADEAGNASHYTTNISEQERTDFNEATPNRFAFKHAHSQLNPEAHWGRNVLQSIRFAFYILNKKYETTIKPSNTIVIASSVSNGGGASIKAAEKDWYGLIDAVVVSEPNINPVKSNKFSIVQGNAAPITEHSRDLFDYTTLQNVYQPCANVAISPALFNLAPSPERCASLKAKGLLTADDLTAQSQEAQQIINNHGWQVEQNIIAPLQWWAYIPPAIAVTYANAYSRSKVTRNLCGYSFAAIDANNSPAPLPLAADAVLFATGNGIPPTGGIQMINNNSLNGPAEDRASISPSTGTADQNLDGALCLRSLSTGRDPVTNERLTGDMLWAHYMIKASIAQVKARGRLRGKPTIMVTGRADAILPTNHTSRAYFGLNKVREGANSSLRYYEIKNAHHLDSINAFPGFAERYVPLHHYFNQALDLMFDHLKNGGDLPPSQVVDTITREVGQPISLTNVPALSQSPAKPITFVNNQVQIPE